ncbi:MAG: deoxyhypusine synthase family protein, partial [Candidatus Heimdallarchaeota archaeon]|nr:deoxyhypusine synthase family protein [Candidatus Heimdallarchaeota archaeon]
MNPKKKQPSKVNPVDMEDISSINELIEQFEQSGVFGPGRIAKAVNIYSSMVNEGAKVFLGLAGALVPGGMRKILTDMIRNDMVDVIVSTGANITHDIIEAFGGEHLKNVSYQSDKELRDKSIDRIYDAFVADDSFGKLEDHIQPIFKEIWEK